MEIGPCNVQNDQSLLWLIAFLPPPDDFEIQIIKTVILCIYWRGRKYQCNQYTGQMYLQKCHLLSLLFHDNVIYVHNMTKTG